MSGLLALLDEILYGKTLYYGTVLCQNFSLQIWWSPLEWHSPSDGLIAQPDKWLCLGTSSFSATADMRRRFFDLRDFLGSFPGWPGEYDYFDDRPVTPPPGGKDETR